MENALCGFEFGGDPIRHGLRERDERERKGGVSAIGTCISKREEVTRVAKRLLKRMMIL